MATADELRISCQQTLDKCREDLKSVLWNYFETCFITRHLPWRAVLGNKKCKPIPIKPKRFSISGVLYTADVEWPNMSEEVLKQEITNLGFVIFGEDISLCVPPIKKGEPLSFAQKCVKKINTQYAEYCLGQKELAQELYPEFISELISVPHEYRIVHTEFTLFRSFKFSKEVSRACYKFIRRLLKRDGIEEYFDGKQYLGLKVNNDSLQK